MDYKIIIILLLLIPGILSISGCINNGTATNETWGEKHISLDKIKVSNDTQGKPYNYYNENGEENHYSVHGYIENQNIYDALSVKIKCTVYDINGTILSTNDTSHLDPKNIPSQGRSEFYFDFKDVDNKIVRYNIEIISAKAEI